MRRKNYILIMSETYRYFVFEMDIAKIFFIGKKIESNKYFPKLWMNCLKFTEK